MEATVKSYVSSRAKQSSFTVEDPFSSAQLLPGFPILRVKRTEEGNPYVYCAVI